MGKLTTHVLDTVHGGPAQGVSVELWRIDGERRTLIGALVTNADGRGDRPLLEGDVMLAGEYEVVFFVRDYFAAKGVESPFLNTVPVRFVIFDAAQNYHVPLLASPWAYSTYRGS